MSDGGLPLPRVIFVSAVRFIVASLFYSGYEYSGHDYSACEDQDNMHSRLYLQCCQSPQRFSDTVAHPIPRQRQNH